jgi:ribosomal protein S18 acetylase RimI-like enzyme
MYTESTGRGHLDGIAVDPNVRGGGLGKALFCYLCYQSKLNGAKYMTFFTGLDNPARYIYLSAGFKIAQSFADMKKDL